MVEVYYLYFWIIWI